MMLLPRMEPRHSPEMAILGHLSHPRLNDDVITITPSLAMQDYSVSQFAKGHQLIVLGGVMLRFQGHEK